MKVFTRKEHKFTFQIFNHLAQAVSKDSSRLPLMQMKIEGKEAVAINGVILNHVTGPEIEKLEDGLYRVKKMTKSEVQIEKLSEHDEKCFTFPKWQQVIPKNYKNIGTLNPNKQETHLGEICMGTLTSYDLTQLRLIIPPVNDFTFGSQDNPLDFDRTVCTKSRDILVITAAHEDHKFLSVCMPIKFTDGITEVMANLIEARHLFEKVKSPKKEPTPPTESPKSVEKREPEKVEEETESIHPTLSRNEEKNGIELRFPERPTSEILAAMKNHGFYWCKRKNGKPWVAKYTEERYIFADNLSKGIAMFPKQTAKTSRAANALSALQ